MQGEALQLWDKTQRQTTGLCRSPQTPMHQIKPFNDAGFFAPPPGGPGQSPRRPGNALAQSMASSTPPKFPAEIVAWPWVKSQIGLPLVNINQSNH